MVFVASSDRDGSLPIPRPPAEEDESSLYDFNCTEAQDFQTNHIETTRTWLDLHQLGFCVSYSTQNVDYQASSKFRRSYSDLYSQNFNSFWGRLYRKLHNKDRLMIKPVADSLWQVGANQGLDRYGMAQLIVSFVQDIPYSFILGEEHCADQNNPEAGCLEGEHLGILSPLEFLHTLYGDCDTRTVLLYTIFKELGYTPKIVISRIYKHSMLLLDVPSAGSYKTYNRQKFYFWETTATGWNIGEIPPAMNDVNNWDIVLH